MQIRWLTVRGFRGINSLDWIVGGAMSCLVGPGDATKTTVLDAIEWVLWSRYNLVVSDADFHGARPDAPIKIEATVGELPDGLKSDAKYGLHLRGWSEAGVLSDEPSEDDELVLTVRMTVDDSLEPTWQVVNDRQNEPKNILARDREALGVVRLGVDVDRHLTWGRGSALGRVTAGSNDVGQALANAGRSARTLIDETGLTELDEAARKAADAAREMGAGGDPGSYRAGLDSGALLAGPGSLGLHEKSIPVRSAGLGSKRLVALGVQRMSVANGAIVLIDEVETGLEPHRLRHLVSTLRDAAADGGTMGQVFLTTHSPTSVVDTDAETLAVVRSEQGKTTVSRVPAGLQAVVRAAPDALLARRVVVAEGKTELGLCRAMATGWSESNQGVPAAHVGCVFVLGNGNAQAPTRSIEIASLGYDVALLADSDQPLNPAPQELAQGGVELFQWDEETCLEERLALDLPIDALSEVLEFAIELRGSQSVLDSLSDSVGNGVGRQESVEEYLRAGVSEEDIRTFIGQCANGQKWFKREDHGERLGGIVVAHLDAMNGTDTLQKLNALRDWVYA